MSSPADYFERGLAGSTEFYENPEPDPYSPSPDEAQPLRESVGVLRDDHTFPPWFNPKEHKPATQQYVEWFNGIWQTGDPSSWNASVFTKNAVMIDPSGISNGAEQAAATFLLLFQYFPELRGEVVTWAANDREIFINWRFEIQPECAQKPFLVPVVDKFCFVKGRVSFRLAYFDIITLTGYLSECFSQDQLLDFLGANFRQAEKTGGIQSIPHMLWSLFKGAFLWPTPPPSIGLSATPGDGVVTLNWKPVKNAAAYTVSRATAIAGPYQTLAPNDEVSESEGEVAVPPPVYHDQTVTSDTTYWYTVSTKLKTWHPVPVQKHLTGKNRIAMGGSSELSY